MSLINDALKRAKESQRNDAPSGVSPMRPVETHCPEREFNFVLPVTISLLIAVALVLIGLALAGHAHKIPAEKLVAAPVIAPKPEVAVAAVPPVTNAPAPAALPTNPPAVSTPVVAAVSAAPPVAASNSVVIRPPPPKPLRLQGIAYDATHPSAIIGGKAVYVGSLVDGMSVTAILPDSVTLAGDGHTKTLVVGQP
jgi:hypothetical protein